jgi:hypothetical protein
MARMVESAKTYVIRDRRVKQFSYYRSKKEAYQELALTIIFDQAPTWKSDNNLYIDKVLPRLTRWLSWLDNRNEQKEVRRQIIKELLPSLCHNPQCEHCNENADTISTLRRGSKYADEYIEILRDMKRNLEEEVTTLENEVARLRIYLRNKTG